MSEKLRVDKIYNNLVSEGNAAIKNNDYNLAITKFTSAIETKPNISEPYFLVANVYISQENYDKALTVLQSGVDKLEGDELDKLNSKLSEVEATVKKIEEETKKKEEEARKKAEEEQKEKKNALSKNALKNLQSNQFHLKQRLMKRILNIKEQRFIEAKEDGLKLLTIESFRE